MNIYTTLLGEHIDLGALTPQAALLVGRLLDLADEYRKSTPADARDHALEYAWAAQDKIARVYPGRPDYIRALGGPVGAVYRDAFFRVYRHGVPSEHHERFLENLLHNPSRPVVECWVDSRLRQRDFADHAGLENAQVSRLISYVLEPWKKSNPNVSLDKLRDACTNLAVVPRWGAVQGGEQEHAAALHTGPAGISARERHSWTLIAAVTRCLHAGENLEALKTCSRLLGLHLAAAYGISDVLMLDHIVDFVLRDILTVPRLQVCGQAGRGKFRESAGAGGFFDPGVRLDGGSVLIADRDLAEQLEPLLRRHCGLRLRRDGDGTDALTASRVESLETANRDAWLQAFDVYARWLDSPAYEESSKEISDQLHPSDEQLDRAQMEGWSKDDALHVEHCAICRPRLKRRPDSPSQGKQDCEEIKCSSKWFRLFVSQRQEDNFKKRQQESTAPAQAPPEIEELREGRERRVISERASYSGGAWVTVTLERDALLVTVTGKEQHGFALLARCTVAGDTDEDLPRRYFPITRKGAGYYSGECRFSRAELRDLRRGTTTGELLLEFRHPSVTLIPVDCLGDEEVLKPQEREKIKKDVTSCCWDAATLASWRSWVKEARNYWKWKSESSSEIIQNWLNDVDCRLDWDVLRAVRRLLEDLRVRVLTRVDERIDSLVTDCMGKCRRAQHGWAFVRQQRTGNYKALATKNTEDKDWLLLKNGHSIVKHVFEDRSGRGYCCWDSQDDCYYWNYDRSDDHRSALCVPVVPASPDPVEGKAPDRPPRADPADRSPPWDPTRPELLERLGVIILESDRRQAFNSGELTALGGIARELIPHLIVRNNLTGAGEPCPWHPSFNEFKGDNNCWHLIDILEQVCHAVVKAVNKYDTVCTFWYLDRAAKRVFALASVSFVQEFKWRSQPFFESSEEPRTLLEKASKVGRGKLFRTEKLGKQVEEEFPQQYRMRLRHPVFMPIYRGEEREPSFLLTVCRSEESPEELPGEKRPGEEELAELAEVLGSLSVRFQDMRLALAGVWFQQHLSKVGGNCVELFARAAALIANMFQLKTCRIWVRDPQKENRFWPIATSEETGLASGWAESGSVYGWAASGLHGRSPAFSQLRAFLASRPQPSLRVYDELDWASRQDNQAVVDDLALLGGRKRPQQVRLLVHAAGKGDTDVILHLTRAIQDRPFTQFNEELLQTVARWCLAVHRDWIRQKQTDNHRGEPGRPLDNLPPAVTSIPALVDSTLAGLIDLLQWEESPCEPGPTARVVFVNGHGEWDDNDIFAEAPPRPAVGGPGERGSRDEARLPRLSKSALDRKQPLMYHAPVTGERHIPANDSRWRAITPFFSWVGRHLARGLLIADLFPTQDNVKEDVNRVLEAARRLSAVFSKENYVAQKDAQPIWREPLSRDEPLSFWEEDGTSSAAMISAVVAQFLEAFPERIAGCRLRLAGAVRAVKDFDKEQFDGWRTVGEMTGAPGRCQDLDLYDVRVCATSPLQMVVPLYLNARPTYALIIGLDEGARPPQRPAQADSDDPLLREKWDEKLGAYLEDLCGFVGRVTGYWEYLTLWLVPTIEIKGDEEGPRWVDVRFPSLGHPVPGRPVGPVPGDTIPSRTSGAK